MAITAQSDSTSKAAVEAYLLRISGRVQGVGFRPFVYSLALRYGVCGWVRNSGGHVDIHAEGVRVNLDAFRLALATDLPPGALVVTSVESYAAVEAFRTFLIKPSRSSGFMDVYPPADLSVCVECLEEMRNSHSRRFRYPFVNCAHCGPRYTLLRSMPYDRLNTAMSEFQLCSNCLIEYCDPLDRRYHAQPLACKQCGPSLKWRQGDETHDGDEACLAAALNALRKGHTVAVRGIGGYHLLCSAASSAAVARLRRRKRRPAKPLAVLVPYSGPDGLNFARLVARLSASDEEALLLPERPIVIVTRLPYGPLADAVAPGLDQIGIMLPYSPLLHLILDEFQGALVATSGNVAGEPILTDPAEAELHLSEVASGFLHHNRTIVRAADDTVVRVIAGHCRPIRLGRGSCPLEFELVEPVLIPTLALGALQKNTIALAWGNRLAISQHVGDFLSIGGRDTLVRTITDFESLYGVTVQQILCDAHSGMKTGQLGPYSRLPTRRMWHHTAHASAVAGEFAGKRIPSCGGERIGFEPMLCFTWDANGLGEDGTLWGGEALLGQPGQWVRVASFRQFPLLGGEAVSYQPWRSALGLCWSAQRTWSEESNFSNPLLRAAYDAHLNCPLSSAVGRLFDAAAALLGICTTSTYSAEAAMRLEMLCGDPKGRLGAIPLPLSTDDGGVLRCDWEPLLVCLLDQSRSAIERSQIFHMSLALALRDQAVQIRSKSGVSLIGLCGGVFQNRWLTETAERLLIQAGFSVFLPQRLPVNDASIGYGQIIEATALASLSGLQPAIA